MRIGIMRGAAAKLLLVALVVLGISMPVGNAVGAENISPAQAKAIIDSGKPFFLLDVRTQKEFADGHIPGAILIPHTEIKSRAASELPDKDIPVLVYCRSGRRSAAAAEVLDSLGYKQVRDLGGIGDWPYETVKQ